MPKYYDEIETISRNELKRIQLEKLKWLVKYCYNNVLAYRQKMDRAGIDPDKIKVLSDIEYIPYTTKEDLRDNYPKGLFARPMKEIVRIHSSSGTTGKPTIVGYTQNDLDTWINIIARACYMSGVSSEDIVNIAFGYGLFTGGLGFHYGAEKLGATIIPSSSGNTDKQILLMQDLNATVLASTPSYALKIIEELRQRNESLNLRTGLMGSENCSEELRRRIESGLNISVYDNYGTSEIGGPGVACECQYQDGLHLAEDHYLPEIIDPDSLDALSIGQSGELVITTLTKEGMPLLRYRTGDITSLNDEVCSCGRTHIRMNKLTGRTDDMLKIKGVKIYPSQIESVLMEISELSDQYELVLTTDGVLDQLEIRVELSSDFQGLDSCSEVDTLLNYIKRKLASVLSLNCKVTLLQSNSILRPEVGKAKRLIDNRVKK